MKNKTTKKLEENIEEHFKNLGMITSFPSLMQYPENKGKYNMLDY